MNELGGIRYLDIKKQIMPGATILIVGKRNSGKSSLLFDILSQISSFFNFGLALTPTQSSKEKFSRCMPPVFIDQQSPERLEHFVKTVNGLYDKAVMNGKPVRQCYFVGDDVAFDEKFMRCKPLKEIFLNGRNFGMTCILVLQYLMKVGPDLRANADFVFLFWDNNMKNQEKAWEFWFNMMGKDEFREAFSTCTKNYSCLVMDVRASATSRDWHDCVYWYKAKLPEEIPPFTTCHRDYFRLNDYCQARDYEERKIKESGKERIWRIGPDGKCFDTENKESENPKPKKLKPKGKAKKLFEISEPGE